MQFELFDSRRLRLARARAALRELDLQAATQELEEHLALYPNDDNARSELSVARRLAERLVDMAAQLGDPVEALLHFESEIDAPLRSGWHRRLATEAERHWGDGCDVGGKPVGLHWQLGGDLERAQRSLSASLERAPDDSQTRVFLANLLFDMGEQDGARREYLRAFLLGPQAIDVETVADTGIAGLLDVARFEYEVPGQPSGWVAAVGIVDGVFAIPAATLPGLEGLTASTDSPGLQFYRCILDERAAQCHKERVRVRYTMKTLCPGLFAAYLHRFR